MDRANKRQDRSTNSGGRFGRSKMSIGRLGVEGSQKYTHRCIVAATDPAYMPASSAEFSKHDARTDDLQKKIDAMHEQICGKKTELLEPEYVEVGIKASRIHVISLCAASIFASLFIFTGVIAPLINGLPHRLFWLSMGLPAAGVAAANILILLGGREEKD